MDGEAKPVGYVLQNLPSKIRLAKFAWQSTPGKIRLAK
jgi:hypothetical protein